MSLEVLAVDVLLCGTHMFVLLFFTSLKVAVATLKATCIVLATAGGGGQMMGGAVLQTFWA